MLDDVRPNLNVSGMCGLLFLIAAALGGIGAVRAFGGGALSSIERAAAGTVVGWMFATAATYTAALLAGGLSRQLMLAASAVAVVFAAWFWWRQRRCRMAARDQDLARLGWKPLILLLAVFVPVYCVLFGTRMLQEKPDGIYSGGTSSYDMAFHSAITTSFLYGKNFPPIYPLLPPEPLLYPPLPDFLTAALVAAGMSLHLALCVTGIVLATAITVLLYAFAARIGSGGTRTSAHNAVAAALAAALFLLNGGLQFAYSFISNFGIAAEPHIQWTNIIIDGLLPQRTSLFGISATLIVFGIFAATWRHWHSSLHANRWSGSRAMLAAGAITGALPFFHTHSYLAIGIVSACLFLLRPRLAWLAFALPAILLALPRLLVLGQHLGATANLRLQPGWLGHAETGWPLIWLNNAGLPALLIIPAWLAADRATRRFYLAFIVLLTIALVVVFSPNDTDNLKLLNYWSAATCVLVAQWLVRLTVEYRQRVIAGLLVLGCIASGVLAIARESVTQELIFDRAQCDAAAFVREHTPPDALFLTAPALHQPVVSLAGRASVRGATAWLWSHGYEFRTREADIRRIYAGAPDSAELIDYYAVDYIYLGAVERSELRASDSTFASLPVVYDHGGIKIFAAKRAGDARSDRDHQLAPRELASRVGRDPAALLIAFPRVSYFLYRLYLVSLGRQPHVDEFMSDLTTLGRGLSIEAPGSEVVLEQNKRAFLEDWIRRNRTGQSVAQLTAAIEKQQLYRHEYNAAYLLMHYFGYLRRNPDDPPDRSRDGYDFWLRNLNRSHDYRSVSRAFLESTEYRNQVPR